MAEVQKKPLFFYGQKVKKMKRGERCRPGDCTKPLTCSREKKRCWKTKQMKSQGEPCQPGECFPLACNRKTKTCGGKQRQLPTKKQPPLSQLMQQNMELQLELKKMSHKFDVVLRELRDCCSNQQPMQIQPMKVSDLPMGLPMGMPTAIKLADWPTKEKEFMGVGKVVETDNVSVQTSSTDVQDIKQIIPEQKASQTQTDDPIIPLKPKSKDQANDPIPPKSQDAAIQTQTDDPIIPLKPKSKDQANDPIPPKSQDAAIQTEEEKAEEIQTEDPPEPLNVTCSPESIQTAIQIFWQQQQQQQQPIEKAVLREGTIVDNPRQILLEFDRDLGPNILQLIKVFVYVNDESRTVETQSIEGAFVRLDLTAEVSPGQEVRVACEETSVMESFSTNISNLLVEPNIEPPIKPVEPLIEPTVPNKRCPPVYPFFCRADSALGKNSKSRCVKAAEDCDMNLTVLKLQKSSQKPWVKQCTEDGIGNECLEGGATLDELYASLTKCDQLPEDWETYIETAKNGMDDVDTSIRPTKRDIEMILLEQVMVYQEKAQSIYNDWMDSKDEIETLKTSCGGRAKEQLEALERIVFGGVFGAKETTIPGIEGFYMKPQTRSHRKNNMFLHNKAVNTYKDILALCLQGGAGQGIFLYEIDDEYNKINNDVPTAIMDFLNDNRSYIDRRVVKTGGSQAVGKEIVGDREVVLVVDGWMAVGKKNTYLSKFRWLIGKVWHGASSGISGVINLVRTISGWVGVTTTIFGIATSVYYYFTGTVNQLLRYMIRYVIVPILYELWKQFPWAREILVQLLKQISPGVLKELLKETFKDILKEELEKQNEGDNKKDQCKPCDCTEDTTDDDTGGTAPEISEENLQNVMNTLDKLKQNAVNALKTLDTLGEQAKLLQRYLRHYDTVKKLYQYSQSFQRTMESFSNKYSAAIEEELVSVKVDIKNISLRFRLRQDIQQYVQLQLREWGFISASRYESTKQVLQRMKVYYPSLAPPHVDRDYPLPQVGRLPDPSRYKITFLPASKTLESRINKGMIERMRNHLSTYPEWLQRPLLTSMQQTPHSTVRYVLKKYSIELPEFVDVERYSILLENCFNLPRSKAVSIYVYKAEWLSTVDVVSQQMAINNQGGIFMGQDMYKLAPDYYSPLFELTISQEFIDMRERLPLHDALAPRPPPNKLVQFIKNNLTKEQALIVGKKIMGYTMDYLKNNWREILAMSLATSLAPMVAPVSTVPYVKNMLPLAKDLFDVATASMNQGSIGFSIETSKKVAKHVTLPLKAKLKYYALRSTDTILRSGLRYAKAVRLGGGGFKQSMDRVKQTYGYRNWQKLKDQPDFQARAAMQQYQEPSSRRGLIKWKIALHDWDYAPFGEYKDAEERRAKKEDLMRQIQQEHPELLFPPVQVQSFDYLSDKQVRSAYERLGIRKWGDMDEDFYPSEEDEKLSYADAVRPPSRGGSDSTIEL